jgi:hypothetical protein
MVRLINYCRFIKLDEIAMTERKLSAIEYTVESEVVCL